MHFSEELMNRPERERTGASNTFANETTSLIGSKKFEDEEVRCIFASKASKSKVATIEKFEVFIVFFKINWTPGV